MSLLPQPNPDHQITVTGGGPFGRAWFDCSCGIAQTHASKLAANTAALRHYGQVYGSTVPGSGDPVPAAAATATASRNQSSSSRSSA